MGCVLPRALWLPFGMGWQGRVCTVEILLCVRESCSLGLQTGSIIGCQSCGPVLSWLVFVDNLTQPSITWEEISTEGLSKSDLWLYLWGIVLVTDWCRRAQPTVRCAVLWADGPRVCTRESWQGGRKKCPLVVSASVPAPRLLP